MMTFALVQIRMQTLVQTFKIPPSVLPSLGLDKTAPLQGSSFSHYKCGVSHNFRDQEVPER